MGAENSLFYPPERKRDNGISVNFHDVTINKDSLATWYIISASKEHFGYFLTNDKGFANLTWLGRGDLPIQESIGDLSKMILGKEFAVNNPELNVRAVFDSQDGVVGNYDLKDRLDYEVYTERLSDRDSFASIRYVVRDDMNSSFVFHVRNSQDPNKIGLGIVLPNKNNFFTLGELGELPDWVMQRHASGESFLRKGIKPRDIFSEINRVAG